jgi:hypothetical protein
LNCKVANIFRTAVVLTLVLCTIGKANGRENSDKFFQQNPADTSRKDTLRYPIYDRYGDPLSAPRRNTFDLRDTAFIKKNIEYDPRTGEYFITEKIGDRYYRTPVSFNREEFMRMQGRRDETDYFRKRASLLTDMNRRNFKPQFQTSPSSTSVPQVKCSCSPAIWDKTSKTQHCRKEREDLVASILT